MSNLVPLANYLIVEPTPQEKQTASGFYIAAKSEGKSDSGVVLAVGPGSKNEDGTIQPMSVVVGDKVLFKKYAPDEFEMSGKKVLVLAETDVLAKIVD